MGDGSKRNEVHHQESVTRRAALMSASAAAGGIGLGALISPDTAFAINTEYFVNAADLGTVGDGKVDDSKALQEAINESITVGKPLYLPPGTYRTTKALVAESSNFAMFGAGSRRSMLAPDASSYDCLTIGPGVGGSGNDPSGYARDFGIKGGNAKVFATGAKPDTSKAAFKLSGMRLFSVQNIVILSDSSFDIGFDLVNNSHGCTFYNCRAGLNACRVGLNIRNGSASGTGSDVTFFNSWFCGEVAAVHIGDEGGGYHFYGGQFTSSRFWEIAAADDKRGSLILGKDYLTEATGRAATCTFEGIDFEGQQGCWMVRAFDEISCTFKDCNFNGYSEASPLTIGVFKSSAFKNGQATFVNTRLMGEFSAAAEDVMTVEGGFSAYSVVELTTSGETDCGDGWIDWRDNAMSLVARVERAFAVNPGLVHMPYDLLLRGSEEEGGFVLQIAGPESWGYESKEGARVLNVDWLSVSPQGNTIASAETITIAPGLTFAKITGTTGIKKIDPTTDGHLLILKFASALTVTDGSNLKLAGNFAATADDTLTLVCDGTNWFEVSRSVN